MKKFNLLIFLTLFFSTLLFTQHAFSTPSIKGVSGLNQLLEQHKGEVVYLDFWASWCGPCRKSFPWMNAMQKTYQNKGFTVIAINLDAEKALAVEFLQQNPALFSVVYDPDGETAKKYKIKGMPSSYLIDRNGKIVSAHSGFFTAKIKHYENEIKQTIEIY